MTALKHPKGYDHGDNRGRVGQPDEARQWTPAPPNIVKRPPKLSPMRRIKK